MKKAASPDGQKAPREMLARIQYSIEEVNRLDLALIGAAKTRGAPPSQAEIFDALSDAAITCADAIEELGDKPAPNNLRSAILLLQVSLTDFAASLKLYAKLVV